MVCSGKVRKRHDNHVSGAWMSAFSVVFRVRCCHSIAFRLSFDSFYTVKAIVLHRESYAFTPWKAMFWHGRNNRVLVKALKHSVLQNGAKKGIFASDGCLVAKIPVFWGLQKSKCKQDACFCDTLSILFPILSAGVPRLCRHAVCPACQRGRWTGCRWNWISLTDSPIPVVWRECAHPWCC